MAGFPTHYIPRSIPPIKAGRILRQALACALLYIACPAFSQSPAAGPFIQRDQFPIRTLFLGLRPEAGDLLPRGSRQWVFRIDYANTYAVTRPVGDPGVAGDYYQDAPLNEYRLFADTETLRLAVDLDWRIASRLQIGLTLPFLKHGGGCSGRNGGGIPQPVQPDQRGQGGDSEKRLRRIRRTKRPVLDRER